MNDNTGTKTTGKKGAKRSLLTEGNGIPLSVAIDGANRHDKKLVKGTLDAIIVERLSPFDIDQNMCMDKGYDFSDMAESVQNTAHTMGKEN